jgi:hypothetical protein
LKDRDLSMSRERRTIPLMREMSSAAKDCPLAPPEHASPYARALHRACLILGGIQSLATHLKVPEADLRRWMAGEEEPPEPIFLAAVEVILLYVDGAGRMN